MHVRNALEQLDQIHDHLTRSEVYRGFRVPSVVTVGIVAFAAALIQQYVPDAAKGSGFVTYWVLVAALCGLIGFAAAVYRYVTREDDFARRRTQRVLAQFLPCILGGAALSIAVSKVPGFVAFLPGLWGIMFGLGIIATRPHLPTGIGPIGLGYVATGAAFLLQTAPNDDPSGWVVGLEFGVGHLLTALVLRREEGETDVGI